MVGSDIVIKPSPKNGSMTVNGREKEASMMEGMLSPVEDAPRRLPKFVTSALLKQVPKVPILLIRQVQQFVVRRQILVSSSISFLVLPHVQHI